MRKFIFSIVICILTFSQILSQEKKLLTKDDIIKDINFLIEDIENIHPEPFHTIEKENFYKEIEFIKNQLPDTLSKIEAWKNLYPILALLKEGHSYFFPPFEEIGDFLKFPYTIKIDKASNDFIISGSINDSLQSKIGDRIVSINGISTDSLISIFKKSISAENDALFYYSCENYLVTSLYAIFGSLEYFDIEIITEGKLEKHAVKCINQTTNKINKEFAFRIINDSIGLISINSMSSFSDFIKFCNSTFNSLNKKKIPNLIIDFRGNKGGDSRIGDELIKYLSDKPFSQWQKGIVKISSVSKERFRYQAKNDTLIEENLTESIKNMISPYPEKKRYSGNIYMLIDGGTFSSAGSTTWCIYHYKIATTIGEETGGLGVHYGYPIKRNLPNTGLTYFISHMKWYQIGADDDSTYGLIPDYKIDLSVVDIKNNIDTALEFTLDLIKSGKSKQ